MSSAMGKGDKMISFLFSFSRLAGEGKQKGWVLEAL
jgi:hypothetical protein